MRKQYDVAVIGGGPAGYVAAIKAAQLGGRAAVFEKSVLGGTCLNRGCIPTKCYLKTAELMEEIAGCTQRGIVLDAHPSVDLPKAVAHKNSVVKKLTEGVAGLLRSHKIDVYYGEAALATENTLTCGGETYGFDSVLLCGGSKPGVIPIPGAESKNVLDSDALLDLEALPRRLAIIGGGVIGCEMAAAFHGFGSQVTVIEAMDRLVPPMDEEISAQLKKSLEKKGIRVLTSQKVSAIQDQGTGSTVLCQDGTRVEADKILICVGRAADLDCLGSLKDRIRLERGKVSVDEQMRTSIPNIYAPGDINGKHMLAHAAFKMGEAAACAAMGRPEACDLRYVPSCIYTSPEAAGVGLSEKAAREQYGRESILVGRYFFQSNGRALASGRGEGFVKVVVEKRYQELLGVHILGGDAAEMIAEAAALLHAEVPADEIADMIHAHPTYSEAFMEACAAALGRCIHLPAGQP